MLKPPATKLEKTAANNELVAAFLSNGGVIVKAETAVAGGLKKTRYKSRKGAKKAA